MPHSCRHYYYKQIFENNLKVLTARKLLGVYCYSLMTHAREQYRIISGRSPNSEGEETLFTTKLAASLLLKEKHPI